MTKNIVFGDAELAALDAEAKREGRSRSQQVNYWIRKAIEARNCTQARELAAAMTEARA